MPCQFTPHLNLCSQFIHTRIEYYFFYFWITISETIIMYYMYIYRVWLVWLPLTCTPFHSLLWEYQLCFMPTLWGMQLGHKTRPGHAIAALKNEFWWMSCMCFLRVFLTALYFRMSYCPHLQSLYSIHASVSCSQVDLEPWGTCMSGVQSLKTGQ